MDLSALKNTPPWDWPEGTGKVLLDILRTDRPSQADLLLATELAGDFTVINDDLADALLSILRSGDKSETVRGRAAISLGPILEPLLLAAIDAAASIRLDELADSDDEDIVAAAAAPGGRRTSVSRAANGFSDSGALGNPSDESARPWSAPA